MDFRDRPGRATPPADATEWRPLPPKEVAALFHDADFRWWIAGGWAIELFVQREIRPHGDTDVGILRSDQAALHTHLSGWQLWTADPPGRLRRWLPGEHLVQGVHDVWCRRSEQEPWALQVQINESQRDMWIYRRDTSVRRPLTELTLAAEDGTPFLCPEIQLLFKSKAIRPQDVADFRASLPLLRRNQRLWLARHLPADHAWQAALLGTDRDG